MAAIELFGGRIRIGTDPIRRDETQQREGPTSYYAALGTRDQFGREAALSLQDALVAMSTLAEDARQGAALDFVNRRFEQATNPAWIAVASDNAQRVGLWFITEQGLVEDFAQAYAIAFPNAQERIRAARQGAEESDIRSVVYETVRPITHR